LDTHVDLSRLRAQVAWSGPATVRLASTVARSGGEAGYLGIAGESLVPILQIAEARVDWRRLGVAGGAGLVDHPFTVQGEETWDRPAVLDTLSLATGLLARADAGGWVAFTAPKGLVSVQVALLSGEGHQLRERNNGKNLVGQVTVRPWGEPGQEPLGITLMAQEGSRGLLSAPDHRLGLRVFERLRPVAAGIEVLLGQGLAGDGERSPLAMGAFARTEGDLPVDAWLRVDRLLLDRDLPESGAFLAGGGVGPKFGTATLSLGLIWRGYQPLALPVAGAEVGQGQTLAFLQLGVRARGQGPAPGWGSTDPG
jgi:hypothetical protein